MKNVFAPAAAFAALLAAAAPAAAAQVSFSYEGLEFTAGGITGAGVDYDAVFTVDDTPVLINGRNAYRVTDASGTRNDVAIAGVLPAATFNNDNYFFYQEPYFGQFTAAQGLGLLLANGDYAQISYDPGSGYYLDAVATGPDHDILGSASFGTATIVGEEPTPPTPPTSPVPEPASWALMVGGFGLAGAALRRQRVAVAFG